MSSNLDLQLEEIEALNSIYETDWHKESSDDNSYSIKITPSVVLFITFNSDYPAKQPPTYQLLAPTLSREKKEQINETFNRIYKDNFGGPVIYQWIEELKELINTQNDDSQAKVEVETEEVCQSVDESKSVKRDFHIEHGTVIKDRKSAFQGHACEVKSHEDVKDVMNILLENKKIAQATHNILAYRIRSPMGSVLQDCDDDGETHAGGRLLHLLQIIDVMDVMVVVTRWYGGINLGPDRFRHINNAGRQVLQQAGYIKSKTEN